MKSHDLKPAPGSRTPRTRVGRGIAAGKGKTAGRGTKGQRSRAGASIPSWFEGGQTPIHIRIPKLRGFKRHGRVEYQVVNVGRIGEYARAGRFGGDPQGKDPITVNVEALRSAGLVSSSEQPLKILGGGDIDVKVIVAAEAFTASARTKIEAAGGYVQPLAPEPTPRKAPRGPRPADGEESGAADAALEGAGAETAGGSAPADEADAAPATKPSRRGKAAAAAEATTDAPADAETAASSAGVETSAAAPDAPEPAEATSTDEPAEEPASDAPADADRATE